MSINKKTIISPVVATIIMAITLSTGCVLDEDFVEETEALEMDYSEGLVPQEEIESNLIPTFPPKCTNSADWLVRYYSDSSKTNRVGTLYCMCGSLSLNGEEGPYHTYIGEFPYCSI